ncbi:MAG: hypothetical protein ACC656_14450, partial [Candidatus Heimdallarchaeota archaeon]
TTQDKVNSVNFRLKRVKYVKDGNTVKVERNKLNPEKPITISYYYKLLGGMVTKTRERGMQISKMYLTDLINEHDTLIQDRKEMREIIQKAEQLEKMQTVVMAKREQIDLGRRIMAVKELIKTLMEEPDLEDEEQVERQIQLLTTS